MDQHGGGLVARALAQHGVRTVFTLCGGHISPILVGCRAEGLAVVDVRDEATAVFAADALARLTGTPGVAVVTAGPGVANTVTALENARLAQSPIVLLGGATATILKGRGALQDIDQMALVRPHVKRATGVRRVRDLPGAVAAAFEAALDAVPGPVFVECPVDLLYPEALVRDWYGAGTRAPRSLAERAMRLYLSRHLARMFAAPSPVWGRGRPGSRSDRGSVRDSFPGSSPASGAAGKPSAAWWRRRPGGRPFPSGGPFPSSGSPAGNADPPSPSSSPPLARREIDRVASALAGAQRPVFVVGSQAVGAGSDVAALAAALDRLGVPTFLSGMARGLLGTSHPSQFRHQRKAALREADLVVLAGTPCDFRLDYGRQISRRAVLVSVNLQRADVTRNRRPTIGIAGPPDRILLQLAGTGVATAPAVRTWVTTLRGRETDREADIARRATAPVRPLNPVAVCAAIERHLPDDSIVVADGGDFVATASYVVHPRRPLSWLDPGVFGTLGVGAGFLLGAHAARPEAELWAIFGDGALGFSLAEFDTLVRHRVPVVAVVGNDGQWAQIARDQARILGDPVGTQLARSAYHDVVNALGGRGFLLDDPACLDTTLQAARAAARQGTPVLVNAQIGETDFREGSISL